jgi:glycosyltransferase involved in cell wall biosynthesis
MHIVQILPALNEGGVERGTVELSREFVRRGHRSTVISCGGRLQAGISAGGGEHVTLDMRSKNPLTAPHRAARLGAVLAALEPSVVHYRSRVPGWLFMLANRRLALPFVSTVHGFNSVSPYSRVMTLGQRVICPGTAVAEYIKKHYRTPDARIRIIHRGIDAVQFAHHGLDMNFMASFEERYNLRDAFVVLAAGRVTRLKGHDVLIRAVAAARTDIPNIKCLIVGGVDSAHGGYGESLGKLVRALGVEDRVVFAGSQSKMAEIYACADVLTSNNESKPEAFGRSMAEALAMDCPVIATRFGGALDIVREGFNGYLYTPGDSGELASLLVRIAGERFSGLRADALERFGLERMTESVLAVYREVGGE